MAVVVRCARQKVALSNQDARRAESRAVMLRKMADDGRQDECQLGSHGLPKKRGSDHGFSRRSNHNTCRCGAVRWGNAHGSICHPKGSLSCRRCSDRAGLDSSYLGTVFRQENNAVAPILVTLTMPPATIGRPGVRRWSGSCCRRLCRVGSIYFGIPARV